MYTPAFLTPSKLSTLAKTESIVNTFSPNSRRSKGVVVGWRSYVGPTGMGSFDKAEPYLKYLEHLNLPKSEIKKVSVDGDDV